MQPPKPSRKLPDVRVTRRSNVHVHSAGGEGSWAISYADMLMVLLSFFVMFFSLKEENPDTVDSQLAKIAASMRSPTSEPSSAGAVPAGPAAARPVNGFKEISDALSIEGVIVKAERDELLISMRGEMFGPGQFRLQPPYDADILAVIDRLRPFKDAIHLTVVGHADQKPVQHKSRLIQDNFDLSSVRALSVLKKFIEGGFPERQTSARASSYFDRDARSVSFVVRAVAQASPVTPAGGPNETK